MAPSLFLLVVISCGGPAGAACSNADPGWALAITFDTGTPLATRPIINILPRPLKLAARHWLRWILDVFGGLTLAAFAITALRERVRIRSIENWVSSQRAGLLTALAERTRLAGSGLTAYVSEAVGLVVSMAQHGRVTVSIWPWLVSYVTYDPPNSKQMRMRLGLADPRRSAFDRLMHETLHVAQFLRERSSSGRDLFEDELLDRIKPREVWAIEAEAYRITDPRNPLIRILLWPGQRAQHAFLVHPRYSLAVLAVLCLLVIASLA